MHIYFLWAILRVIHSSIWLWGLYCLGFSAQFGPAIHFSLAADRLGRGLRGQIGVQGFGRGLRGQTGMQSLDRSVPLLIHKVPGAKSRLPGTYSLSPLTQGVSCDCQDGQHGGSIPYKSPRGFTIAHPKQDMYVVSSFGFRTSSSPWERFTSQKSWTSQPTFCRDRSSGRRSGSWTAKR